MKFNKKSSSSNTTVNHEGSKVYKMNPHLELYTTVCTSILEPKFYETETLDRIISLMKQCDPEFVANLIVYAREKMNLRTTPLVMAVEYTRNSMPKGKLVVEKVINRVDELSEALAIFQNIDGRDKNTSYPVSFNTQKVKKLNKVPNQLLKGISKAFQKFDEYQFAKYKGNGKDVSLRDTMFLSHPKPKDEEQKQVFQRIASNTLEVPYTWETQLSNAGKNGRSKKDVWEEMIDSGRLGYMALLRNLRNLINVDVSYDHLIKVKNILTNEDNVKRSKQFPFRFLSAYRMLTNENYNKQSKIQLLLNALNEAVVYSINNIEFFNPTDNVLIACDVSGSMRTPMSSKSTMFNIDIGLVLGMLLRHKCNFTTTGIFGNNWEVVNLPTKEPLTNAGVVSTKLYNKVGLATNGYKVLKWVNDKEMSFDKICLFTDVQMYSTDSYFIFDNDKKNIEQQWKRYKKMCPGSKLYLFDLGGYGTTPLEIEKNDVHLISGWSSEIFNVLNSIDNGGNALNNIMNMNVLG